MKFITPILFATLFVGASADPFDCTDNVLGNMDLHMIEKAGKTLPDPLDKSFPFGKVFFVDEDGKKTDATDPAKLVTHIYVEFNTLKLGEAIDERDLTLIGGYQDVYVGVPKGSEDCGATGTIVDTSSFNPANTFVKISDIDYASRHPPTDASTCFPSTIQGRVTRIAVVIKDPLKAGSPILTTNPEGDRTIEFCYRVGFKQDNGDVVSYKDTKVLGAVSLEGVFGSFDTPVKIMEPDATELDTTVASKVDVTVGLCNKKNEVTNSARDKQYQIGQNFRLCVESAEEDYEVEAFTEVSCGSRQLVVDSAVTDDLSEIFEHPNAAGTRFALRSVITAVIITEGKSSGEIPCQGIVAMKKKDTNQGARNLQISSGSETDDEPVATLFDLKLNLVTPNANIESSASFPSSIFPTAVALVGFVVALFL